MDINELESFKMSDAVKFHKELNPQLWEDEKLDPEVRDQLLLIAEDFVEYLGISNLKIKDVTISGSNAAYSYTPHSDLDLHILVDFNELPNNEVYQELFTAKKTLYNDAHDITVHGVPVELYVQDTNQPVQSLGEYSIVHDKWIRIPKKRRANFDQAATKAKYEKLGDLIELALKSRDPKRVADTIALVKRYRKSGLDKHGEFGPENLAYKAVRKQGLVQDLYDLKSQLNGEKLSIEEEYKLLNKPTLTVAELAEKHGVSRMDIAKQLDKGVKVELEHTKDKSVAREIALDHLAEDPKYYDKLDKAELEEAMAYHVTPTRNLRSIMKNGLRPQIGDRSSQLDGEVEGIFLFPSLGDVEAAVSSWLGDEFDEDEELSLLAVDITGLENNIVQGADYETIVNTTISPDRIKVDDSLLLEESDYANYEKKIEDFVQSLNPDDVGVEQIGPYHVHFEGFTDECQEHAWERCELPSSDPRHLATYDDVYKEVISDFVRREGGKKPLKVGFAGYQDYPVIYAVFHNPEPYKNPDAWNPFNVNEASGYIPSTKEKNDPRFKTALTVDVKPDSIKKNAKAFNWKTSRAGIPPQANPNGKIAEDLMKEWKSFLAEDQEQQELFPGYDEKHRQERLNAWLANSQAVTANYKPKVLYHATTKHFDQFRAHNKGFASALGMTFEVDRSGIFLAENPKFAAEYIEDEYGAYKENAVIIPVYLSAQYTFVLTDSGLSPMLNDEALVEEFKEHDIDLRSIYYHIYEDQRWELFDGPEGEEFVANLKKLGYDSAFMYEDSKYLGRNGVWVAFEPSQVKAITNRGSFSPDDPRLMKENG